MIMMRVSFLLALVPAVAVADASTPDKSPAANAPNEPRALEYWLDSDGKEPHCAPKNARGCDLTPLSFDVDGQRVTVGFERDYKIHVRADKGELVLDAAGQGFMSRTRGNGTAQPPRARRAPGPPLELGSRPEACSDYWDVYVSVVGGVPRQALALYGLADPPAMSSSTAKLAGDTAVVTTRTAEDEKHTRVKRTRYRWNGSAYVEIAVSKRAATRSK